MIPDPPNQTLLITPEMFRTIENLRFFDPDKAKDRYRMLQYQIAAAQRRGRSVMFLREAPCPLVHLEERRIAA